jgi:hypothetical protein
VTIACCCAVQLGIYPWLMFWACMFSFFAFYCAHWQTYVSGKLKFGKYVEKKSIYFCVLFIKMKFYLDLTVPKHNFHLLLFI